MEVGGKKRGLGEVAEEVGERRYREASGPPLSPLCGSPPSGRGACTGHCYFLVTTRHHSLVTRYLLIPPRTSFLYLSPTCFARIDQNSPRRTVSFCFPGAIPGFPGSPGVRSQKVQRVILSIQSVLPSEGSRESLRMFEKN